MACLRMLAVLTLLGLVPASAALGATRSGTPGPDRITARGSQPQQINGSGGGDTIVGGVADDVLLGETGHDRISGGAGKDTIDGGSGDDRVVGQSGDDSVVGGFGRDTIDGGDGDDVLDSGSAGDRVAGGAGNDTIHAGGGTDSVVAGSGNDNVYSDSGADRLDAGEGDDTVYVNNGSAVDTVDCGAGQDTIYINPYANRGGISNAKALRSGRIRGCETVLEQVRTKDPTIGVHRMIRAAGGGTLRGTELKDTLLGGSGPDRLGGLGGDDVLWGNRLPTGASRGVDRIAGGDGNDTAYGGRGSNVIDGGAGDDYLQGGPGDNQILGGFGDDTVRLTGYGRNSVRTGDGNDVVDAYSRTPVTIDCGPGGDRVNIGFNRGVRTVNCETVTKRYR